MKAGLLIVILAVLALLAAAHPEHIRPAIVRVPGPTAVKVQGRDLFTTTIVDPNASEHVVLPDGSISGVRVLPAAVATNIYHHAHDGSILPPIPTVVPRYHRRAIRRVEKSMELLSRAEDALVAHLHDLTAMKAKVQAKLQRLNNEQLKHGYVVLPDAPVGATTVVPRQVKNLLRRYLSTSLAETEAKSEADNHAETETETETEAEAEVDVNSVLSLIEADSESLEF